jgi:hypothetical protein
MRKAGRRGKKAFRSSQPAFFLQKIVQALGIARQIFPRLGKIADLVSNHWKSWLGLGWLWFVWRTTRWFDKLTTGAPALPASGGFCLAPSAGLGAFAATLLP